MYILHLALKSSRQRSSKYAVPFKVSNHAVLTGNYLGAQLSEAVVRRMFSGKYNQPRPVESQTQQTGLTGGSHVIS